MNQSIDCQEFVDFVESTLKTNIFLIEHQTSLYELANENEDKTDFYLMMANKIEILDFKQIIQIGLEKLEDMNSDSNSITHRSSNESITSIQLVADAMKDSFLLNITNSAKIHEARMIKARMVVQSSLLELYMEFVKKAMSTNSALLEQRLKLFELATNNPKRANHFLNKATQIVILDCEQLINIGYGAIIQLNERNKQELDYLSYRLQLLEKITTDD